MIVGSNDFGSREVNARLAQEGLDKIAAWFETLARAEKSHAGRFTRGRETLGV